MNVTYLIIGVLGGGLLVAIFLMLARRGRAGDVALAGKLELIERVQERSERMLREEMVRSREEGANAAKTQREELTKSLEGVRSIVDLRLKQLQEDNSKQIDKMRALLMRNCRAPWKNAWRIVQVGERSPGAGASGLGADAAISERRRRLAARPYERENARRLERMAARRLVGRNADTRAVCQKHEDPR
jgi:hypothetical protein